MRDDARRAGRLAAVLMLAALVAPPAAADTYSPLGYSMPDRFSDMGAVWTGTAAYLFGGNGAGRTIHKYVPSSGTVVEIATRLPAERYNLSAVWDGRYAYLFGGFTGLFTPTRDIFRFDPVTETVTMMAAKLPTARAATSAVWTGQYAYVFGGEGISQIVRYDPATDTAAATGSVLPAGMSARTAAVWSGSEAYVFGGNDAFYGTPTDRIVRYRPESGAVDTLPARLPTRRAGVSAVWDGYNAIVFGGYDYSTNAYATYTDILKFSPQTMAVSPMSQELETAYAGMGAVEYGGIVYLFGGHYEERECGDYGYCYNYYYWSSQLARYTLEPDNPRSVTALPGPGLGDVTIFWEPPPPDTYSAPITSYRVWRGSSLLGDSVPIAEVFGGSYTDSGCPRGQQCWYELTAINAHGESPKGGLAVAVGWRV